MKKTQAVSISFESNLVFLKKNQIDDIQFKCDVICYQMISNLIKINLRYEKNQHIN
jgi:hypothetical protein